MMKARIKAIFFLSRGLRKSHFVSPHKNGVISLRGYNRKAGPIFYSFLTPDKRAPLRIVGKGRSVKGGRIFLMWKGVRAFRATLRKG